MSEEQLKAFLEKVKGDTVLQEKLRAAADSDAVLAIAKETGFSVSADDMKKAQSDIEDVELEAAAGGGAVTDQPYMCPIKHDCHTKRPDRPSCACRSYKA